MGASRGSPAGSDRPRSKCHNPSGSMARLHHWCCIRDTCSALGVRDRGGEDDERDGRDYREVIFSAHGLLTSSNVRCFASIFGCRRLESERMNRTRAARYVRPELTCVVCRFEAQTQGLSVRKLDTRYRTDEGQLATRWG